MRNFEKVRKLFLILVSFLHNWLRMRHCEEAAKLPTWQSIILYRFSKLFTTSCRSLVMKLLLISVFCTAFASTPKIEVLGLRGEILKDTTTKLQLMLEEVHETMPQNIQEFCLTIPPSVKHSLKYYGYFHADAKVSVSKDRRNRWRIVVNVVLGEPARVGSVELKILGPGSTEQALLSRLYRLPLSKGDVFQVDRYNTAKQFLLDLADEYGYTKASFVAKEVQVDLATNSVTILLHLNTGVRHYFGTTTFQTSFFNKKFLANFLPYKAGDYFSNKRLHSLNGVLNNSNFFQTVDIKLLPSNEITHEIPVEITITPKKKQQYNVGVGYSTDMGMRGLLEVNYRYLTSTAHSMKGRIHASEVQKNAELLFLIPGIYAPATDLYSFSLAGETINIDKGESISGTIGTNYATTLRRKWRQNIGLNLHHEHYKLSALPSVTTNLLIGDVSWSREDKDDLLNPNKGYNIKLQLQGSSKYLISKDNFLQMKLQAKYLHTFGRNTQLLLNSLLGFTAIHNINSLPLSLQFYTGGAKSIRGFSYNSIGPGTHLVLGSVTLRQKVVGSLYVETFFDAGKVGNDFFEKPERSVGVGLVWRTVVGSLEISFAKAISQPGSPGRVQFSIGTDI